MGKTLQQRFSFGLLKLGYTEQPRTAHYRVFHHPKSYRPWIYVGSGGALRWNSHGKVSKGTIVCGPQTRLTILEAVEGQPTPETA